MTNDVSPQLILAFLNDAWNRAPEKANTLRQQLLEDQLAALSLVKSGSIASVGKNSANQAYKNYGPGALTHTQVVEVVSNLLGIYDQIQAELTELFLDSEDFGAVPDGYDFDPVVYAQLQKVFSALSGGVAQTLPDITSLRLPPTAILSPSPVTTW